MNLILEVLLLTLVGAVALPILVLFVECLAAQFARPASAPAAGPPPRRIAVLISAHNEELLIEATVRSLLPQLRPADELLVVADNCADRTAERARRAGARVIERHDEARRGKGYGLSFGVEHLRPSPPEILILFDADMLVPPGAVPRLAGEAAALQRPIQARYLQQAPPEAGARGRISTLAFIVKNAVRPAGLDRLGIPCALTGTGMAFPWALIQNAPLASGHLVEDMELGLHFLRAGRGPKFCPAVTLAGDLPGDAHAAYVQRTRWEHGHLGIIRAQVLPLLISGIRQVRLDLLASALDLAVPPLALLAGLWGFTLLLSLALALLRGLWLPALLAAIAGAFMLLAIVAAWRKHARNLPLRALLAVPLYVLWKVPLYVKYLFRRQTAWIRTSRGPLPAHAKGATPA